MVVCPMKNDKKKSSLNCKYSIKSKLVNFDFLAKVNQSGYLRCKIEKVGLIIEFGIYLN